MKSTGLSNRHQATQLRDDSDSNGMVAIDQVALAEQSLTAGQLDEAFAHANQALKADPRSAV